MAKTSNMQSLQDFIKNYRAITKVLGDAKTTTSPADTLGQAATTLSAIGALAGAGGNSKKIDTVYTTEDQEIRGNDIPRMLVDESGNIYNTSSDAFKEKLQQTSDVVKFKSLNGVNYEFPGMKETAKGSDIFDKAYNFFGDAINNGKNFLQNLRSTDNSQTGSGSTTAEDEDVIEYTYKKGDTFGQVIKDLGLKSEKGLWGSDGDVAYYTKQLREQGIPGMIPIGTTIRLRRRPSARSTTTNTNKIGYQYTDANGVKHYGA